MTETVGTFTTLDEAVPFLRAASDFLKQKYSGFFAAAGGYSYSESEQQSDGIAAVERAGAEKPDHSIAAAVTARLTAAEVAGQHGLPEKIDQPHQQR